MIKICIVGTRSAGKTSQVKQIINHFNDIDEGLIFCPREQFHPEYKYFVRENIKINFKYDDQIINDFLKQKSKKRRLLVLDDAVRFSERPLHLINILHNQYNILLIITMQYPLNFGLDRQFLFDYVILLRRHYVHLLKKIHEYFVFHLIPSLGDFRDMMPNNLIVDNITNNVYLFSKLW